MHRPTLLTLALTISLGLAATGCTNHPDPPPITDPPTTSTTASEPTGTPDPQTRDEAAAAAAYEHYFDVMNQVRQRPGAQGWATDLLPLTTGKYRAVVVNLYTQLAEQGVYTTGPSELVSVTPTEYVPDPTGVGHQQVILDVCIDSTDPRMVLPDGTEAGWGMRAIEKVMMQKIADGGWLVSESTTQEGATC